MDKQLLIIIIFLTISFAFIGIYSMGIIPTIFQTKDIANQTLVQNHEDQARLNQTIHEDGARANQSQMILNETNASINKHHKELEEYMNKIFKDNHILLRNQDSMLNNMSILLNDTVDRIIDNQIKVSKYGTENNAIDRAVAEKLGLNVSDVLKEYYIENNITPVYPPPPKPPKGLESMNMTTD
jgi:hypothetical protein